MSGASSGWGFDRDRLWDALERWRAHDPSDEEIDLVVGFLMDLVADPMSRGKEDGSSRVWTSWASPFILVTYVPDRDNRRIYVADINHA